MCGTKYAQGMKGAASTTARSKCNAATRCKKTLSSCMLLQELCKSRNQEVNNFLDMASFDRGLRCVNLICMSECGPIEGQAI